MDQQGHQVGKQQQRQQQQQHSSNKQQGGSLFLESSLPLNKIVGNAVILLNDWEKYGLTERVCYHFDLIEALTITPLTTDNQHEQQQQNLEQQNPAIGTKSRGGGNKGEDDHYGSLSRNLMDDSCGVSALLECVPQGGRLRGDQKRKLRTAIRNFNSTALRRGAQQREGAVGPCHQPPTLPLRINSSSNVAFAYETTRIAFCLDASPTLTSTFGFKKSRNECCPLDRLIPMARTFFTYIAKPIRIQSGAHLGDNNKAVWQPELAVSVLAVFPGSQFGPKARLLVRDFPVRDVGDAELLVERMEEWALGEVENEIANRLAHPEGTLNIISSYETGMIPLYSSSLRDLLDAGDSALATLSSCARPLIVLATDGRSLSCDAIIDVVSDTNRVDVPLVVLDLSSTESHAASSPISVVEEQEKNRNANFHMLSYDPVGALFPLHLSDDNEALYGICR